MPAISEAQRKAAAIAKHSPSKLFKRNRGLLSMSKEKLGHFAEKTKTKLLRRNRR